MAENNIVDIDALGDITKTTSTQVERVTKSARELIPQLDESTQAIANINKQFLSTITNIQTQAEQEYNNLVSIRKMQEKTSWATGKLRNIIGLFDSDFNDRAQQAKAEQSVISLQMLKQKQENASLARNLAVDTINTMTESAVKKLNVESTTLDILNKSIDAQRSILALSGEQERFQLTHMTPEQLRQLAERDKSKANVVQDELARRENRDLALSNLRFAIQDAEIRSKKLKETDLLQRATDEELESPEFTKDFPQQAIFEEISRRKTLTREQRTQEIQMFLNETKLLENNLKLAAEQFTAPELHKLLEEAEKSDSGMATVTVNGQKFNLSKQNIVSMIQHRTAKNQEFAAKQGELAAKRAEAESSFNLVETQLQQMSRVLPTGIPKDVQVQIHTQIKAYEAARNQGSPDAMKKVADNMQKILDQAQKDILESFPEKDKAADFVKKIIKQGQADPISAAPFIISAAASPAFARGGVYAKYGEEFVEGLTRIISPNVMVGGKPNIEALIAASERAKKSPDQVTREAFTRKNKDGATLTDLMSADRLGDYTAAILQKLALPGSSQFGAGNPFEKLIDPVTGRFAASVSSSTGLSFRKLLEELAYMTLDGQKNGMLKPGQDLIDIFVGELDNSKSKDEYIKSLRSRYNLVDHAFAALAFGNDEVGFVNDAMVKYVLENIDTARAVAEERMKRAENTAAIVTEITKTGSGMSGGPVIGRSDKQILGLPANFGRNPVQAGFPVPIVNPTNRGNP